jgi:hypothetical protein
MQSLWLLLLVPAWIFFVVFLAQAMVNFTLRHDKKWWSMPLYFTAAVPIFLLGALGIFGLVACVLMGIK